MEGRTKEEQAGPLTGGRLLATISNRMVSIMREHYGRGPMKAKTYALDDVVVVVLRDSGFTALERTIIDGGDTERVVRMREDFHAIMASRYRATIESLTGRSVTVCFSRSSVEPDVTVETFLMDRPLGGFTTPDPPDPAS